RRGGQRPGTSVVEFAFVAPVFFLLLLGVFEYSRFLFAAQMLDNAAREGARYAVVNTTTETTTGVQNYVNQFLVGQGAGQLSGYSPSSNISVFKADSAGADSGVSWQNASWGDFIGVTVSGTYKPLTPGLLKMTGSITLKGTCVIAVEAN